MKVTLPKPKQAYDYTNEVELRRTLENALNNALASGETITLQPNQRIVMSSPDGTRFYLTVDNSGVVGATAL